MCKRRKMDRMAARQQNRMERQMDAGTSNNFTSTVGQFNWVPGNNRATLREFYYKVLIQDSTRKNLWENERAKFYFYCKVMEALNRTKSLLDVASIKFKNNQVEIVYGAHYKYTLVEVNNFTNLAITNFLMSVMNSDYMLQTKQISIGVTFTKRGRNKMGAYNGWMPKAYLVMACGRMGKMAFPDGESMRYYLQLMKLANQNLPVEVVAYSFSHNDVYLVMMSMDQTEVSIRRYMDSVNREYIKYYNNVDRFKSFTPVGNLFIPTLYCKEIKPDTSKFNRGAPDAYIGRTPKTQIFYDTYHEIFDCIADVHYQPVYYRLAPTPGDYKYSSYHDFYREGSFLSPVRTTKVIAPGSDPTYREDEKMRVSSLDMLAIYLKVHGPFNNASYSIDDPLSQANDLVSIQNAFRSAHERRTPRFLRNLVGVCRLYHYRDNFVITAEHALATYKVLRADSIPANVFAKIVAEINEIGDFDFATICKKLIVKPKQRYNLLVDTAMELIVNRSASFDDVIRRLNVSGTYNTAQIAYDIVLNICESKGYSYDYIMGKLEFGYPNIAFCKGLFKYATKTRGYDFTHLIKMFGIYDRGLMDQLIIKK